MPSSVGKLARGPAKLDFTGRALHNVSPALDLLHPGGALNTNIANGNPITGRSVLDPGSFVLHAPPGAPPPPPTFPDTAGAEVNAKRAVRRRAVTGGIGSTILTGGYSPTGQASPVLGGAS